MKTFKNNFQCQQRAEHTEKLENSVEDLKDELEKSRANHLAEVFQKMAEES